MSTDAQHGLHDTHGDHAQEGVVPMPAPTQWPLVMAVGLTLIFAGLVTNMMISWLGIAMAVAGAVGWFPPGAAARRARDVARDLGSHRRRA